MSESWLLDYYQSAFRVLAAFPPSHAKFCGDRLKNAGDIRDWKFVLPEKVSQSSQIFLGILPPKTSHHAKFHRDWSNQLGDRGVMSTTSTTTTTTTTTRDSADCYCPMEWAQIHHKCIWNYDTVCLRHNKILNLYMQCQIFVDVTQ